MRRFCILLLCCVASSLAVAQEPYHIKTDVLGESVATFKQNHQDEKLECPTITTGPVELAGLRFCMTLYQPLTYAGEPASSRLANFADDRLYEITYFFDSSAMDKKRFGLYYDRLLQPLTEKFGKPTDVKDSDFVNITGGNLKNQVATWKNEVSTIQLEKCSGGDPYTTMLTFSLDKLKGDATRRQYKARHTASDM
jgi:hypothetical protein